ncbi:hypothetical protein GGI15_001742 [Coemansia interrupta]|uniref:Uncharacterized protein n=1 Tax=Coemansia interrupta TaxID=1126814 RepID=A0A9W8HH24_9FUNG|nr:hypothetical protein GGI15_001742 [Coemansia interrupta]
MSFSLTQDELTRIETAQFLGISLDPVGYVDLSTIVILSSMYAIEFIALCYQLHNRNYPPLKVKNVPVMFSLYLGAVCWLMGDIFTGGLVHLGQSPVLRACKFTLIWCRACMGAFYVTLMFALRCYSLYHVFHRGKAFKGRTALLSTAGTVLAIILFGIISTLVPTSMTTYYEDILDICYTTRNYIISVLLVIWSIWGYVAIMSWRMRNIPFCFNERIEIASTFFVILVISVFNTVCLLVIPVYPASRAWRNILLYINHVGASTVYWIVMWEPTINCISNREVYLNWWISKLKGDSMERQYDYSTENKIDTMNLVNAPDMSPKESSFTHSDMAITDDGTEFTNLSQHMMV